MIKISFSQLFEMIEKEVQPDELIIDDRIYCWDGYTYIRRTDMTVLPYDNMKNLAKKKILIMNQDLKRNERSYLKAMIKPFRDDVEMITKMDSPDGREFIAICLKGDICVPLPPFESGAYYTGLEINVPYSPDTLDL